MSLHKYVAAHYKNTPLAEDPIALQQKTAVVVHALHSTLHRWTATNSNFIAKVLSEAIKKEIGADKQPMLDAMHNILAKNDLAMGQSQNNAFSTHFDKQLKKMQIGHNRSLGLGNNSDQVQPNKDALDSMVSNLQKSFAAISATSLEAMQFYRQINTSGILEKKVETIAMEQIKDSLSPAVKNIERGGVPPLISAICVLTDDPRKVNLFQDTSLATQALASSAAGLERESYRLAINAIKPEPPKKVHYDPNNIPEWTLM